MIFCMFFFLKNIIIIIINVWYDSWVPFDATLRGSESHVDVLEWHVRVGMQVE